MLEYVMPEVRDFHYLATIGAEDMLNMSAAAGGCGSGSGCGGRYQTSLSLPA